jgi:hypothetical protein
VLVKWEKGNWALTLDVAVGEIVGPVVGGPIYDYFGHWAVFGVVETLLLIDILLRVLAKDNESGVHTETQGGARYECQRRTRLGDKLRFFKMGKKARLIITPWLVLQKRNSHKSALNRVGIELVGHCVHPDRHLHGRSG